jgi:hypothetical protein
MWHDKIEAWPLIQAQAGIPSVSKNETISAAKDRASPLTEAVVS